MAEQETSTTEGPYQGPALLTEEQRATFRLAGFWMAIIGWSEVLFRALTGLLWSLATIYGLAGQVLDLAPSERHLLALQVVGATAIGALTLTAARSFRRAGRGSTTSLPAATAAVADLAELYERQVYIVVALVIFVIAGAIGNLW